MVTSKFLNLLLFINYTKDLNSSYYKYIYENTKTNPRQNQGITNVN
jgi:hypothetical protein